MIYLINILDIFYSIIKEFKICIPESKHYLGRLEEKVARPSFLYTMVFSKDTRSSYMFKDTMIDLQIIYFGVTDKFGHENYEDRLKTINLLKQFLSQFNIQVKDRNLKFDYSFGEADEQLTINMQFKFKDELVNLEYDKNQAREKIREINYNKEVIV